MSTNSYICKLDKDTKTIIGSYCHWDGYPEGVGDTLVSCYKDNNIVDELIALGSISSLKSKVKPEEGRVHSFDNPDNGVTIAYYRDRHEPWDYNKFQLFTYNQFLRFMTNPENIEFVYLYVNEQVGWVFWDTYYTENKKLKEIPNLAQKVTDYLNQGGNSNE